MLAGFIDATAGGGGLLTVPALLAAGMSPAGRLPPTNSGMRRFALLIALLCSAQSGESRRSEAQYPDDVYWLDGGRAAGPARTVRHSAPDPADSGYLYWPLFLTDAKARRGRPGAATARPAVCADCRWLRRFYDGFFGREQARFTRWHS